jgi:hypothetical protein
MRVGMLDRQAVESGRRVEVAMPRSLVCLMAMCTLQMACGGRPPSAPSTGPFPMSKAGCPYYISGLSRFVVDPSASLLEARVPVGQLPTIGIAAACGSWRGPFSFSSTNNAVVSVDQLPGFGGGPGPSGLLVATQPGQAQIYLEFRDDDDRGHRTTLGYCALQGSSYCTDPREITTLTIVRQ